MILSFEPPAELVEFMWEAAKAAGQAIGDVPHRVTPLHVLGPQRGRHIVRARRLFFALMRRHVWCASVPNGTCGELPVAIVFGDVAPFPGRRKPVPLTTRMIAWLMGRTHAGICMARRSELPAAVLESAERYLSEVYQPGRIEGVATFRSRVRHW